LPAWLPVLMSASDVDPWLKARTCGYITTHPAGIWQPELCRQQFRHVRPADAVCNAYSTLWKLTVRPVGFGLFCLSF